MTETVYGISDILEVQKKIIREFNARNIPYILYGSTVITDRQTNDIDFIVKIDDFTSGKIDEMFKDMGYHDPIPFIFEKKFIDGSPLNIEVKYDLHPKITKTLQELWDNTIINEEGYCVFNPTFHALLLYLHTDRHIREGLFDNRRIYDLLKIQTERKKIKRLANKYGVKEQIDNIQSLLDGKSCGYSREEIFYPSKKKLFEDARTLELLGQLRPREVPEAWKDNLKTIAQYRKNRIKEYRRFIHKPDHRIAWEVGYTSTS